MSNKTLILIAILLMILVPSAAVTIDTDAHVEREGGEDITWYVPVFTGDIITGHVRVSTPTDITEDEVRESMGSARVRAVIFGRYGYCDVPDCPLSVIEGIDEAVRGTGGDMSDYPDHKKCLVIQSFVAGIRYASDRDLYGCREFMATPTETLYYGKGDCEDSSILFVSIARAYGLDSVVVLCRDHTVAGVRLEGRGDLDGYALLECTVTGRLRELEYADCEPLHVSGGTVDEVIGPLIRLSAAIGRYNPIVYIWEIFS